MARSKAAARKKRRNDDAPRRNRADTKIRSAADVKALPECLGQFRDDELAQIPIMRPGAWLQPGAVYLDLRNPSSEPFVATGEERAAKDDLYVAKAETPYVYWNRLVGVLCPGAGSKASEADSTHAGDNPISEEMIDKTLADSFPASDPPSWTTGREPARRQ